MAKFGMGQPVKRLEDQKFITGAGRYTDDIALAKSTHGFVLRSPHAHARINGVSTADALKTPGVLLILTAKDIKEAGFGTLPCMIDLKNRDGSNMAKPARPILADGVVRHVGDPVAFIVARWSGTQFRGDKRGRERFVHRIDGDCARHSFRRVGRREVRCQSHQLRN